MFNIQSGSKSVGQDAKRAAQVRHQPLREHELLGLPKSTGKKDSMNKTMTDKPALQPYRIKDLFSSANCKKSTKSVADRRMTTMPNATNSVRRKLYNDHPQFQASSDHTFAMTASSHLDKPLTDIHGNNEGQKTSGSLHLGLSKSDVKINKWGALGRERLQPERLKNALETWEKSQTVQPSARKTITVETRNKDVRRKLYSVSHSSPITISKNNRKSVAPNKLETQKNSIVNANVKEKSEISKIVKPEISKNSRKSSLLPPNSIRDKYVNNRQNDTIAEESTQTSINENESSKIANSNENLAISKISENNEIDKLKSSLSVEIIEKEDMKNDDKNCDEMMKNEIPRPSVIMGISAKGLRREQDNVSSDGKKSSVQFSRIPLQELSKNKLLRKARLNEANTSLEDLLGNISRCERGESIYYENLPRLSFLESTKKTKNSSINIDRQTLEWMRGNLKLNVQLIEEQLFSVKQLLNSVEELLKNRDNTKSQNFEEKIETNDVSSISTDIIAKSVVTLKITENESIIRQENDIDRQTMENMPEMIVSTVENNIENLENTEESPIFVNLEDHNKENSDNIVEKPRRRSERLAKKLSRSPKHSDDSFCRNEEKLNIVHEKTIQKTPLNVKIGKRFDPRSRRSVREYMALKSTMNILDTPDIKGFPTPKGEKNTPSQARVIRRCLSRKVLTELDDLYAESPM